MAGGLRDRLAVSRVGSVRLGEAAAGFLCVRGGVEKETFGELRLLLFVSWCWLAALVVGALMAGGRKTQKDTQKHGETQLVGVVA